MRLFSAQSAFPSYVYQTIHNGSGWGSWRQLSSLGGSTNQPSAATVNGDVNLLTKWFVNGNAEQTVE